MVGIDGQHRAGGQLDDFFGHAAEENFLQALVAVGTHDDHVHRVGAGKGENLLGHIADKYRGLVQQGRVQILGDKGQHLILGAFEHLVLKLRDGDVGHEETGIIIKTLHDKDHGQFGPEFFGEFAALLENFAGVFREIDRDEDVFDGHHGRPLVWN